MDKQIISNDYIFELNEMCIDCISEIDECECRRIAENLHFKLYRKEQESEELKEMLKDKTDEYNKLAVNYDAYVSMANKQLDQLKAENETLKAEYTRVHTQLASQEAYMLVDGEEVWRGPTRKLKQENEKLKAENEELKYKAEFYENYNAAHINKITKLEKTLTEIKEMAEDTIDMFYEGLETGSTYDRIITILQKISEVEDV